MNTNRHDVQRAIERLLFAANASRAMLVTEHGKRSRVVAEAVRHGLNQLRHGNNPLDAEEAARSALGQTDLAIIAGPYGERSRAIAPLNAGHGATAGLLLDRNDHEVWTDSDLEVIEQAGGELGDVVHREDPPASLEVSFAMASGEGILEALRTMLNVQRCTWRQPVLGAYAFPVTLESRDPGVRSLLGDFTIVQTGQPVINLLLSTRAQVVQPDCESASGDPKFHMMLDHYGGLRAQVVTPYIVKEELRGVLSVHQLGQTRDWTAAETSVAAAAARLLGGLFEGQAGRS